MGGGRGMGRGMGRGRGRGGGEVGEGEVWPLCWGHVNTCSLVFDTCPGSSVVLNTVNGTWGQIREYRGHWWSS